MRARIARGFILRLGIVAVVATGFALWALYDGFIAYPQQQQRARKYQELAGEDEIMDDVEQEQWDQLAAENGWPQDDPGPPKTKYDIAMQYMMAATAAPFGLLYLVFFLRNWGRWIEATNRGLNTSWNQSFDYDQIISLDKKQWQKKGIVKIQYAQDGRQRRLVLDDFKYEFEPTKNILIAVEGHLRTDQILDTPAEKQSDQAGEEADDQQPQDSATKSEED
ncbi:MAG: hypothetical protein GTO26_06335 [Planctomycetales bacterium]|nr:hypothetical protein [Planctomycetales bacterium]NIP69393.1 hypothetical protein [Planctomycetales bacterium]